MRINGKAKSASMGIGSPSTITNAYEMWVGALVELNNLGRKPRAMDYHKRNVAAAGSEQAKEWRHVLIDYRNGNEEIKAKMLTRKRAWELNNMLKGSGIAWAVKGE